MPILDQPGASQDRADAFFFGLDAEGHLLARLGSGPSVVKVRSEAAVPLRSWTLVTLTIDSAGLVAFAIDDKSSSSKTLEKQLRGL